MRFAALILLGATLVSLPSVAQEAGHGMVVSGFNCRQTMPCDLDNQILPPAEQVISLGNSCVNHYMGSLPGSNPFEEPSIDADGCLTTNPAAFPATEKASMQPYCCIKKAGPGQCILSCDVVSM